MPALSVPYAVFIVVALSGSICFSQNCGGISDTWADLDTLTDKLLSYCRPDSGERSQDELNFKGSTFILYRLGRLFWKRTNEEIGIDKKRNYIRSAALLYGSKVRYDIFLMAYLGRFVGNEQWFIQMETAISNQFLECTEILGNAYVANLESYNVFERRNNISLCITAVKRMKNLSDLVDNFISDLEDEEAIHPNEFANTRTVLAKLNLNMSQKVMLDLYHLARNRTCLQNDLNAMLDDLMKTVLTDQGNMSLIHTNVNMFTNVSLKISETLQRFREIEKTKLGEIVSIRGEVWIDEIGAILQGNSRRYAQLLENISDACLDVLPYRHSNFAVMNFGSVSRDEVTLYSDSEHAILYLNSPEETTNQNETDNYFLWYTTLFHIIVISLQETMIHTVNITQLGGYHDSFTPRGFAFDGMFKPFGKIPFGNGEVRLILDVGDSELSFFGDDNTFLMRTSFAFGSKDVYEKFKSLRTKYVEKQESVLLNLKNEVDRLTTTSRGVISGKDLSYLAKAYEDPKNSLYRPISVILEYMARVYEFYEGSTSEFLDEITQCYSQSAFDKMAIENIKYNLILSSEVRMKIYAKYGRQMYDVSKDEIFNYMEKTDYVRAFITNVVLRNTLIDLDQSCSSKNSKSSYPNPVVSLRRSELEFVSNFPNKFHEVADKNILDPYEDLESIHDFFLEISNTSQPAWEAVGGAKYFGNWSLILDDTIELFGSILWHVTPDWGTHYDAVVRSSLLLFMGPCLFSNNCDEVNLDGLSLEAIVGISVGCSAVVLAIIIGGIWYFRK